MASSLLQESESIKNKINDLRTITKELEGAYKQGLYAITPEQQNKATADITRLTDQTNAIIHDIKGNLDAFRAGRPGQSATDMQMRENQSEALKKRFADLLQEFQRQQVDYKDKTRQRLEQKIKIVKPNATPYEIDQAIETGDVNRIYAMETGQLTAQARNALSYVKDRHKEIVQLDVSIRELNQLFLDMAILVESSGAVLNQVEMNVGSAVIDSADANKLLHQAAASQKKSRKKMLFIIVLLVVILVVILGSSLGAAFKNRGS